MKSLLLLLTVCVFVSVACSAPGPAYLEQFKTVASSSLPGLVDLQQFITQQQNRLDAVSDEGSLDTTTSNRDSNQLEDIVTLKQFNDHRGLSDRVSAQERALQDNNVERDDAKATHKKRYGKVSAQTTAGDSAVLIETLPELTKEQFWRAVINNIMAQQQ